MSRGRARCDLTGQKFGRLTAIEDVGKNTFGQRMWRCKCDCGNETVALTLSLKTKNTQSCGCLRSERMSVIGKQRTTHGLSRTYWKITWRDMHIRCYNKKNNRYDNYGGRGIKVHYFFHHDNPDGFLNWVYYMKLNCGDRPQKYSLDRIDNDGHYAPGNLRWADSKTQSNNRRNNICNGDTHEN